MKELLSYYVITSSTGQHSVHRNVGVGTGNESIARGYDSYVDCCDSYGGRGIDVCDGCDDRGDDDSDEGSYCGCYACEGFHAYEGCCGYCSRRDGSGSDGDCHCICKAD